MEEEEDPFAFLLVNSKPSISQEEILRNCPFAKEHDHFMDSDTQSSTWVSSQQTGIIMESLPDSDNFNDVKDGVHDDEKFLTPPEHHFYSVSDSDDVEVGFIEGKSELNVECGGGGVGVGGFEVVGSGDLGGEGGVGVGIDEVGSDDLGKMNEFEAEGDVGVEIDELGSGNLVKSNNFEIVGGVEVGIEELGSGNLAKSNNFGAEGGVEVGIEEVGSGYLGKREDFVAEGGVEVAIEGSSNGDLVKIDDFGVEGDIGIGIKEVGISDFEVLGSGDLVKRRDFGAEGDMGVAIGVAGIGDLGKDNFGTEGDVQVGMEVDKMNLEGEGCDCVIKDHELEFCGGEFDKKGVLRGETESKEVTVETLEVPVETDCVKGAQDTENVDTEVTYLPSAEIVSNEVTVETVEVGVETDCVKGTQDTENVDTEDIYFPSEETVVCPGDDETEVVDDMEVQSRVDLEGDQVGDLGFGMDGNLEGEQCDYIVHDTQTEVVVSEFDKNGVLDLEIMSKKIMVSEELESGVCEVGTGCVEKMQHIENVNTDIIPDSEEQTEEITLNNEKLVTHLNLAKKDHHEGDIVNKRKLLNRMGDDGGLNVLSSGKNELVNSEDINGIENGGHKENVNLRIRGKRKLQRSDTIRSGKSKEDIEKFRYVKPSVGADQRWEDKRVPEEGNVPLSKIEKAPQIEVGHGSVYKGNSSFLKLVYKASDVLKLKVDPDHNVDLLDILKEKGITLPRPRWWPPEGFN